jgi:signal transduction histidine kinase
MTPSLRAVYRDDVRARLARLRPDPVRLDWLVAAFLTVTVELEAWFAVSGGQRLAAAVFGPVMTATVAVRRRYPAPAGIAAATVAGVVATVWGPPNVVSYGLAWICAMYGLAVWAGPRGFAVGAAVVALSSVAAGVGPKVSASSSFQFGIVSLAVLLIVRRVVRDREQRARIAERERDLAAREAVVEERARIARELHDAIAHNVSMIVVQAGAERRVLDGAPGTTREVLQTIEQIGRSALTEMRRLVGMLRTDADDALTPQPGLGDVPTLVTQVCEAGLPVELQIDGERRELPVGIELSAYRIVQEALTNAMKHAGEAHATVHVHYGPDSLELEIVDDGAPAHRLAPRGGHGLVGMRERVALYGGRFDARRNPSGGFVVRAKLPIA